MQWVIAQDDESPQLRLLISGFLFLAVIGGAVDLVLDRPTSWWTLHVGFELVLVVLSLTFAIVVWRGWSGTIVRLQASQSELAARESERDAWRRSAQQALEGFSHAIDRQFATWNLTPAEREVAFALLQGRGHKEIALRTGGRSERTVRQQAVSVYRKSGMRGRAELAAYFLQDLMLPAGAQHTSQGGSG